MAKDVTVTITLKDETYATLAEAAQEQGCDIEELLPTLAALGLEVAAAQIREQAR